MQLSRIKGLKKNMLIYEMQNDEMSFVHFKHILRLRSKYLRDRFKLNLFLQMNEYCTTICSDLY